MKIAIVTASIGSNKPIEYREKFSNAEYISFNDYLDNSNNYWINKPVIDFSADNKFRNRRNAKIYKVLTHIFLPEYDYYIWIDSTHAVKKDPEWIIENYVKEQGIGLFKHSKRKCLYEEGKEIIRKKQDDIDKVERQMKFYKSENVEKNLGLYELSAFVKKNDFKINALMHSWWEQICMFSSRDQISMPYVLKKYKIQPSILPGKARGRFSNSLMPQVHKWRHDRSNIEKF